MKYLLMVVLLFSFNQVMADFMVGNKLLNACEAQIKGESDQYIVAIACVVYILGVVDSHNTLSDSAWEGFEMKFCLPESIDGGQLVRVVTKYLQENPKHLHLGASDMVLNSLSAAFPCE